MAVRIAINGLGRIGRCVLRAITEYERDDVEVVAALPILNNTCIY